MSWSRLTASRRALSIVGKQDLVYGYPSRTWSAEQLLLGNQMERIPVPEERIGGSRILPKQLKGEGFGVLLAKRHSLKRGHWHGLAEAKVEPSARLVQLLPRQLRFGGSP